jgi:hypothetical protein
VAIVACSSCGAENPEGASRCEVCGAALTIVAAGPPSPAEGERESTGDLPTGVGSGMATPAGYPSPNYVRTTPAPTGTVHRLHWSRIVGAIAAALVLLSVSGLVIALISGQLAGSTSSPGISGQPPSPSPSGTPNPSSSPSPVQTGPTQSNNGESVPVPTGWSVVNIDSQNITLTDSSGAGSVTVASGPSSPTETAEQKRDSINRYFESRYPDANPCPNSTSRSGELNGVSGIFWTLCFTFTTGGQSFPAASAMFVGANLDGSVYYEVAVLTSQDNMQSFVDESKPIVQGIQWKLS